MAETEISLDTANNNGDVSVTLAKPRKLLYFSDGIEEEFEDEETDNLQAAPPAEPQVDPKTLPWSSWLTHHACKSGEKIVSTMDYLGENLAEFLGITTPKYQIEIDEHERMQEEKRKMDEDSAGWVSNNDGGIPLVNAPRREVDKDMV